MKSFIDIVFEGSPSPPEGAKFVEVENANRESIQLGEWVERDDGYWALRITRLPETISDQKDLEFLRELKEHVEEGRTEYVNQMLTDWINELEGKS